MITNHDLLDNLRGQVYHLQQKLIEAQDCLAAEKSACEELHKREVEYQQEISDLKARLDDAYTHDEAMVKSCEGMTALARKFEQERDAAIAEKEKVEATLIKSLDRNDTLQERVVGLEREAEIDDEAYRGVLKKYDEAIRERDALFASRQMASTVYLDRIARLVGLLKDIRDVYRDHDGPTWERIDAEIGEKP